MRQILEIHTDLPTDDHDGGRVRERGAGGASVLRCWRETPESQAEAASASVPVPKVTMERINRLVEHVVVPVVAAKGPSNRSTRQSDAAGFYEVRQYPIFPGKMDQWVKIME